MRVHTRCNGLALFAFAALGLGALAARRFRALGAARLAAARLACRRRATRRLAWRRRAALRFACRSFGAARLARRALGCALLLRRNLGTRLASFGQTDRYRLLAALDRLAGAPALQRATLALMHRFLDFAGRLFSILSHVHLR